MKDFMIRKGQAWDACNRLQPIWQSNIPRSTKLAFFRACVESTLIWVKDMDNDEEGPAGLA